MYGNNISCSTLQNQNPKMVVGENLGEQSELFNPKRSSGGEGVKGEIDGGGAMGVPAPSLAAIRPRLMFLRHNRHLSAVQELKHEQEHLIPNAVHRNHLPAAGSPRRRRSHRPHPRAHWVSSSSSSAAASPRRLRPTKEFPKEQAPSRQDAPVGMDQPPLHAEGYIAERLAVDEQIEII